jgi:tetratricopeptide (TPR) repeat protein
LILRRRVLGIAALLLVLAGQALAETAPQPATPEGVLSFAEALLRSGESFRAVTEYLRFLHHYPNHPDEPRALEGLGNAYAQAGRWGEAVAAFARLADLAPADRTRRLLGSALYQAGRYEEAARVFLTPGAGEPDSTLGTLALLRSGVLEPLSKGARADLAKEYRALPRKSPLLAGALSAVLPGSGTRSCRLSSTGLSSGEPTSLLAGESGLSPGSSGSSRPAGTAGTS